MFHTNLLSLVKIRPVGAPKRDQHSFPLSFSEDLIVKLNFKKTEKIKPFALTRFQCYLFNVFLFLLCSLLPRIILMRKKTLQI